MNIQTTPDPAKAQTQVSAQEPQRGTKAVVRQNRRHGGASRVKSARKPTRSKKGTQPRQKPTAARRTTKTAKILALLRRPGGVTLKGLVKATSWQAHSVRGYLSILSHRKGVRVHSKKSPTGERSYAVKA